MVTRKKIKVPIFNYLIDTIIFDDWSDLYGILDKDVYEEGSSRGITVNYGNYSLVCINKKHFSTIVHEAGHLVNSIWRFIGYEPSRDNDEPSQYLLTYIFERIEDVWKKHY